MVVAIKDLKVFLSSCSLHNEPDMARATIKAGYIARALSIYRVNEVVIYDSSRANACKNHGQFLKTILEYARVPPYLKKAVFPKKKELQYAGLLPPLQLPTHSVGPFPQEGEIREALIIRARKNKLLLDVGLPSLVEVEKPKSQISEEDKPKRMNRSPVEKTILVKITGTNPLRVKILERESGYYRGYSVKYGGLLSDYLREIRGKYYTIGTSRKGRPIWKLTGSFVNGVLTFKGRVAIFFGEPYRGLYEVLDQDYGIYADEVFDDVFNFIPDQGTKTVRIEEALLSVLQTVRFVEYKHLIDQPHIEDRE